MGLARNLRDTRYEIAQVAKINFLVERKSKPAAARAGHREKDRKKKVT
jgi:hypothetical protein